jgi:hypothetical protein
VFPNPITAELNGAQDLLAATFFDLYRRLDFSESSGGVHCGLGIVATRALGAIASTDCRIHFVVQCSAGHGFGDLYILGSLAFAVG